MSVAEQTGSTGSGAVAAKPPAQRMQRGTIVHAASIAIGIVQACATPFASVGGYRSMTPFLFAIVALLWFARKQPALVRV